MLVLAVLLVLGGARGAQAAAVRSGVLAVEGRAVTLQLDGPVTARVLALAEPLRLVVDLDGVDAARRDVDGQGAIRHARIGQFDQATARIVIDLDTPMRVDAAAQGPDNRLRLSLVPAAKPAFDALVKRGRRVLEVTGAAVPKPIVAAVVVAPPAPAKVVPAPAKVVAVPPPSDFDLPASMFPDATAPAEAVPTSPPPKVDSIPKVAPAPRSGGPRPLVVIDAGHGGKDVGAISITGSYEKDVTLAIARAAARALEASGRVRVKLTREDDRFIPLGGRVAIARAAHADLFLSVHADSAPNPLARGASVYTLSETSSDEVAARLAARENKSDIIAGVNLGIEAPEVGDILIDLLQRNTMNVSIAFAEALQGELDDRIAFRGEFHHFAGFRVLKAADTPSVLLETGYVSNADDAALLTSKAGQKIIGDGIARAVEAHLLRGRGR
jgi:N-acetylmuramoyl-L-alanine amidase